ncbi:HNH endonuclease [Novosphingobium sp. UBA1939]|uniref:HNH endonuclease n=1 Tax=Novosphingobium sp. UBA1939 TaxID=1946982 RepID=UPI0025F5BDF0|nr:HNH endonuclease [Novosphingobium sp. UBA1939]
MTALCIFCDNHVGPGTKPEHILLDALGGRKTTKKAVCSSCNQTFGSEIDGALPDQLRVLRNMFQMHAGSGQAPPGLPRISSVTGSVSFDSDGTPKRVGGKPFTAVPISNGRWNLSLNVSSPAQLRKYVPHAAAAMGMSEDRLWSQIEGREASIKTEFLEPVHAQLQCGGAEALRSMTKSSLALLATLVGTKPLRGPSFAASRDFVLQGSRDFLEHRTAIDARQLPSPAYEHLVTAHGPMFNLIYVRSDGRGRTLAYFHLFNLFSWQIVLAEADGPTNVGIALASNPLEPAQWDDEVAPKAHFDFDWLNEPDDSDQVGTGLARLSAIMELYQDVSRKRTIRKVITETFGKYYAEGEMITMDEKGKAAIAEVSRALTVTLMQVATERKFLLTRPDPTHG